jgi:holo-[acyl-carrier protein] synthase
MQAGVVAHAREVVAIAETEALLAAGGADAIFTVDERRYADSKVDPARRLAARWAAKRAAIAALGGEIGLQEVEIRRGHGAPSLLLHGRAAERHQALGGGRLHVSITHGLEHAAASVVLEAAE